jgi:hypothetical protein
MSPPSPPPHSAKRGHAAAVRRQAAAGARYLRAGACAAGALGAEAGLLLLLGAALAELAALHLALVEARHEVVHVLRVRRALIRTHAPRAAAPSPRGMCVGQSKGIMTSQLGALSLP